MIPKSRISVNQKLETITEGGIIGIIQDNISLNHIYKLLFSKHNIDYLTYFFNEDYISFIQEHKPRSIILEFDNLDLLRYTISKISWGKFQLVYYGFAGEDLLKELNENDVHYVRYGNWNGLVEKIK